MNQGLIDYNSHIALVGDVFEVLYTPCRNQPLDINMPLLCINKVRNAAIDEQGRLKCSIYTINLEAMSHCMSSPR